MTSLSPELSPEIWNALLALDTPTVCNALEIVNPGRRARGFNIRPFVCVRPSLPPILGFARTVRIRAAHKPARRMRLLLALRKSASLRNAAAFEWSQARMGAAELTDDRSLSLYRI